MSPKLIALFLAGSGGIAGSGCGIYYATDLARSSKDSESRDQTSKESLRLTNSEKPSSASFDVSANSSEPSWVQDKTEQDSSDDDDLADEEASTKTSGSLFFIKEKDETGWDENSYTYKLEVKYGSDFIRPTNSVFEVSFSTTSDITAINSLVNLFTTDISFKFDGIDDVMKEVKKYEDRFTSTFDVSVYQQLKEGVEKLS
ncbi:hypothetical protein MHLP_02045 [Candidatus Mycoplasma haematolamae str. Purdue]|uniref:Lipoprotein n=1 Tax=Mycoplasma haematolamae (strain Purdue) TaxID=1212765 RepID=I7CJG9_MYCHA|nr:hypothetical protein MHLP_02045 [Candidatus Mycoplasma haematolamae str. Purdue]